MFYYALKNVLESCVRKSWKNVSKHPKVCWKNVLEYPKNVGKKVEYVVPK